MVKSFSSRGCILSPSLVSAASPRPCSRLLQDPCCLQAGQSQDAALLGWTAGLRQPRGHKRVCEWCLLSRAWLFVTPRTTARQASVSMGVECPCWGGLPCPPPGDCSNPGTEVASAALAGGLFTTEPPKKPSIRVRLCHNLRFRTHPPERIYLSSWSFVCLNTWQGD